MCVCVYTHLAYGVKVNTVRAPSTIYAGQDHPCLQIILPSICKD